MNKDTSALSRLEKGIAFGRFVRRRKSAQHQGLAVDKEDRTPDPPTPWDTDKYTSGCVRKIERDVIARGVFTSVPDLRRKLMRCIRQYSKAPKTVKWRYFNPGLRITPDSVVTVH